MFFYASAVGQRIHYLHVVNLGDSKSQMLFRRQFAKNIKKSGNCRLEFKRLLLEDICCGWFENCLSDRALGDHRYAWCAHACRS